MEHYSNFCTFEIASLVNVPGHYLRKYGSLGTYFHSEQTDTIVKDAIVF